MFLASGGLSERRARGIFNEKNSVFWYLEGLRSVAFGACLSRNIMFLASGWCAGGIFTEKNNVFVILRGSERRARRIFVEKKREL